MRSLMFIQKDSTFACDDYYPWLQTAVDLDREMESDTGIEIKFRTIGTRGQVSKRRVREEKGGFRREGRKEEESRMERRSLKR